MTYKPLHYLRLLPNLILYFLPPLFLLIALIPLMAGMKLYVSMKVGTVFVFFDGENPLSLVFGM